MDRGRPAALSAHWIPEPFAAAADKRELLQTEWSVDRYTDFLIDRAELLAQGPNAFLNKLVES